MVCLKEVLCLPHVLWFRDNNVNISSLSCGAKKDAARAADDCPMNFALTETASNSVAGWTDNYSAWRSGLVRVELGDAAGAARSLLRTSRRRTLSARGRKRGCWRRHRSGRNRRRRWKRSIRWLQQDFVSE